MKEISKENSLYFSDHYILSHFNLSVNYIVIVNLQINRYINI